MTDVSLLNSQLTANDIEEIYRAVLGRSVGDNEYKKTLVSSGRTAGSLLEELAVSDELAMRVTRRLHIPYSRQMVDDHRYRDPTNLRRSAFEPEMVLLIGSCLMDFWPGILKEVTPSTIVEKITFNNSSTLPVISDKTAKKITFQILQLPLRSLLHESKYFPLKADEDASWQLVFKQACGRMEMNLAALLGYNRQFGIPTFVLNFALPQQNPMGRLQSRYHLSNMVYFIECLNERLYSLCSNLQNVFVIDFDQIISTFGRKYFQDDSISHINHGSDIGALASGADRDRLEPMGDVGLLYTPQRKKYISVLYSEIVSSYRSIHQFDAIKLVIFDLDDTLWRGVAAELDNIGPEMTEGWPISILEAASYLWKRGILLAIVSKNDEATARELWRRLNQHRFDIANFVSVQISWDDKAYSVQKVLNQVNLLPDSVLFVDDNPVERSALKSMIPGIRTLDVPLAEWRRSLLWAGELQPASLTSEAVNRTKMVQAQIERDVARESTDREAFLRDLGVWICPRNVTGRHESLFERCFDLLNKTNQFNTTGRRWTIPEIEAFFRERGVIIGFDVGDRFTHYGVTLLVLLKGDYVHQLVMSCRIFGMGVEDAALYLAFRSVNSADKNKLLSIDIHRTSRNMLAVDFLSRLGGAEASGKLTIPGCNLTLPCHISTREERVI